MYLRKQIHSWLFAVSLFAPGSMKLYWKFSWRELKEADLMSLSLLVLQGFFTHLINGSKLNSHAYAFLFIAHVNWYEKSGVILTLWLPRSVILLTICHTILMLSIWRIWYWINSWSLNWYFTLFSSLLCLILYWDCKEKFSLSH